MIDVETLKILAPLGIGGILAGVMFFIYRKDAIEWQEAWKGQTALLISVVKENTVAITALVERLRQRDRDRDGRDGPDGRER